VEILFLIFVPLVVGVWALTITLDKARVRKYLEKIGHSAVTVRWRLFGHGWLSESSKEGGGNRIYEVEYRNVYGNTHHVWAKTAMLSGVFLSKDRITAHATVGRPMTAEEKVAFLEEELKKMRGQQ
jgi:hypothetical protein